MSADMVKAIEEISRDGQLACADAHDLAARLDMIPLDIAKVVNKATELRIDRCQLGLFGYGSKPEGKHKILLPAARVPEEIEAAIQARVSKGAISCQAVWELAEEFKYPRLGIANITELLGLKVKPCQLGCF